MQPVINLYCFIDALQFLPNWMDANKEASESLRDIFDFYYQNARRQMENKAPVQIAFNNALGVIQSSHINSQSAK